MATDVDSVASAVLGLSLSRTAATAGQPPQPNFPLPRELRDQIYGYLLHHKHVYDEPYYLRSKERRGEVSEASMRDLSIAHTYRFHTNILAVNHEVSKEAAQVLLANNFIVVSDKWESFTGYKNRLVLPIVTENPTHIQRFKHYKVRVHIARSNEPANVKLGSFLIVAEELPELCMMVRLLFYIANTHTKLLICEDDDASPWPAPCQHGSGTASRDAAITIQFKDKRQMEDRPELAKSLLLSFKKMIFGMSKSKIINAPDFLAPHVQEVEQIMAPKVIWVRAMTWDMFETCKYFQTTAERLLRAGDKRRAALWYKNLSAVHMQCPIFKRQGEITSHGSDPASPIGALYCMFFNAAVTSAFLNISMGSVSEEISMFPVRMIAAIGTDLPFLSSRVNDTLNGMLRTNRVDEVAIWASLLLRSIFDRSEDTLQDLLRRMLTLHDSLSDLEHFRHDLQLIKNITNNKAVRIAYLGGPALLTDSDLAGLTSAAKLPPQIFSPPSFDHFVQPRGFEGFFDKASFEKLRSIDPERAEKLLED